MARGHQKAQSQAKNLKKQEGSQKGGGGDQKKAALKALNHKCTVCMALMPDPKTYKQHFESKHPKSDLPSELVDVVIMLIGQLLRLHIYITIIPLRP
uniref:Small EDRK-rich factor-like N-terminal domain-containing protein n=1 Tax=Ditylenchus dipsaci TaxID=166011 RepID=A0A915DF68_9BILA